MEGENPKRIWVYWPHHGGEPVVWTKPCPFPYSDEATCGEYVLAEPEMAKDNISEAIKNARGGDAPVESKKFA